MKVGVIIPLGENEDLGRCYTWPEIASRAAAAEDGGLDSVWIYDHLFFRFPEKPTQGVHEAFGIWTALAATTTRVELGALVLCTAFRNPAVMAKQAVTLDAISGGRIILGIGAGWHQPEFDAFDISFEKKVERFEEACKIIVPLVKQGTVDFHGVHYSAPNCEMLPRPEREIPVLIASFQPRMLRATADFADQWNTAWLGHADALAPRVEKLNAACVEAGRDPQTLEVTVGISVNFPDLDDIGEKAQDRSKWISGSVDDVANALAAWEATGAGHLIAQIAPGTEEAIGRFADAVARWRSRSAGA
jgi:alkanesulfonate monooxygenase SsuD/methylene tetrahydromethanopterin reductase-like flavin-dependent oxidoreductase (luciferase family)